MKGLKNINFKKVLKIFLWVSLGTGTLTLLVAAINYRDSKKCQGINIEISGVNNNYFIDKNDISTLLEKKFGKKLQGQLIKNFDLTAMENELKKDIWVNKSELYFDNNGILNIKVEEKEPVARVFSSDGNSFYVDSLNNILPLNIKHAAILPVFTNFPTSLRVLAKADSNLLNDVKHIGIYIKNDPFLFSMIDQIDINTDREFEFIPKLGNFLIQFGNAADMTNKFEKLKLFYKKIIPLKGLGVYNKVNLSYRNQIVATIKGANDVIADSLRTLQMMKAMTDYAMKMSADSSKSMLEDNHNNSTDASMILKSFQREELTTDKSDNVSLIEEKKPASVTKNQTIKKSDKTINKKPIKENKSIKNQKNITIKNDY
jgi:cell division protein FtsQ